MDGLATCMCSQMAPEESAMKRVFDQMMVEDEELRGNMKFKQKLVSKHGPDPQAFRNWLCDAVYKKMTGKNYADKT